MVHAPDGAVAAVSPFMAHCQLGVLQYVVLKVTLTLLSFGLEVMGLFGEGEFTFSKGEWLGPFLGPV